jgi:hypothetical protein
MRWMMRILGDWYFGPVLGDIFKSALVGPVNPPIPYPFV